MKRYQKDYAQHIKAKLADYILRIYDESEIVLATEVPIFGKKSIIDMMVIDDTHIFGYEIKSKFDSAKRMPQQMANYLKSLNGVYLVCSTHLKITHSINPAIGVLHYEQNVIRSKRKPRLRKYPEKEHLIEYLWKKDLVSNQNDSNYSVEKLRERAVNSMTRKELMLKAAEALRKRYRERYELFLKSRGTMTCAQDIDILTMKNDYVY